MHLEPRPLPASYSQLSEAFSYSPYSNGVPISLPHDLTRLYQERDVLSKALADCVTYLKALRDKQARCARRLDVQPPLPQKKRKSLQQTKRHLDSEIKNRQLAERACLNNLQACETNMYLANMKAYQLGNASFQALGFLSTPTSYTPTLCSNSESEATDLTWEGRTDESVASLSQKKSSNLVFVGDLAPDAFEEDRRRDSAVVKDVKRPPPLFSDAVELSNSLPVPPNTAHSQYSRSLFMSPTAPVFRPRASPVVQKDSFLRLNTGELRMPSSATADIKELVHKRRFSAAGIVTVMDSFNIAAQSPLHNLSGHHTWGRTPPQACLQKDARPPMNRQRTNSL